MKAGTVIAILAAFLAVSLTSYRANADGGGVFSQATGDGACDSWARITTASATCMSSDWSHMGIPPYWETWAKNHCSSYGNIEAHVDVPNEGDTHIHAHGSSKAYGGSTTSKPRSIKCCINTSDLCWKDQVEAHTSGEHAGKVRIIQLYSSGWGVSYADVSSHEARYTLCNSDTWTDGTIYCEEDPDGDAHIFPASFQPDPATASMSILRARPCGGEGEPGCTCSSHICDRFDCEWHFDQSPASNTCGRYGGNGGAGFTHSERSMWSCGVDVRCRVGVRGYIGIYEENATFDGAMWELTSLNNCGGVLQRADCGETYSAANCLAAFERSPAADSCTDLSAQMGYQSSGGNFCSLSATCDGGYTRVSMSLSVADNLRNCSGVLDIAC